MGTPAAGNDSINTCHSTLGPRDVEWAPPLPCVIWNRKVPLSGLSLCGNASTQRLHQHCATSSCYGSPGPCASDNAHSPLCVVPCDAALFCFTLVKNKGVPPGNCVTRGDPPQQQAQGAAQHGPEDDADSSAVYVLG